MQVSLLSEFMGLGSPFSLVDLLDNQKLLQLTTLISNTATQKLLGPLIYYSMHSFIYNRVYNLYAGLYVDLESIGCIHLQKFLSNFKI